MGRPRRKIHVFLCLYFKLRTNEIIAVFMYRLVMINIDLSQTAHFAHWKSDTTTETNFYLTIFFSNKFFFQFFSQTGFCLGLYTAAVFRMQSFNIDRVSRTVLNAEVTFHCMSGSILCTDKH